MKKSLTRYDVFELGSWSGSVCLLVAFFTTACGSFLFAEEIASKPWPAHTIDNTSIGADGVRLLDVNGDGLPDNVTGWEEGNITKVYLHPGYEKVRDFWPSVKIGKTPSVEDAVFVDLDGDGIHDVVSSTEGKSKRIFFHWAPKDRKDYMKESAWKTEVLPASVGMSMWMFCVPMQIDDQNGIDLVFGGKDLKANLLKGGSTTPKLGWFESPPNPRDMEAWKWHPLGPATWIMSLIAVDMDGDGNQDVLVTDRWREGCFWLRHPGWDDPEKLRRPWELIRLHRDEKIEPKKNEMMFACLADLDRDGLEDVLIAIKPRTILWLRRLDGSGRRWEKYPIQVGNKTGTMKGVAVGDLNNDGKNEIVITCEDAQKSCGIAWLSYDRSPMEPVWKFHDLSGPNGIKYDQPFLVDLNGDGKLDVITTEERDSTSKLGFGIIWHENPLD